MHPARLAALVLLTACATTQQPARQPEAVVPFDGRVLESGGELNVDAPLDPSTIGGGKQIHVIAIIEVAGNTRLQPALAMADAQARTELVKSVRVGVASAFSERSEKRGDKETQFITQATAEVTSGVLPTLPPIKHGWRKIERNGEVILELAAQLTADRAVVVEALSRAFKAEPDGPSLALRAAALIQSKGSTP